MWSELLNVFGAIGIGILILLAIAGWVAFLAHRGGSSRPDRSGAAPTGDVCPRCAGRGRFVAADGREWPCLDRGYRHADD